MPAGGGLVRRHRSRQARGRHQDGDDARRGLRRRRPVNLSAEGVAPGGCAMTVPFLRPHENGALGLEAVGMTKRFGGLTALDDVTMRFSAGSFHALLGENGAGKSTLVKCIMGYYHADQGQVAVGEQEREIANPRDAHALGVGMVYQHFTLVPGMTVAENLVLSRSVVPAVVKWADERRDLDSFMAGMPFRVPLDVPVSALAAGEKQKLEI